jgi:hypothetical protein
LLDARPSVGFVYGHALWVIEGNPLPTARTKVRGWSVWPGARWLEHRFRQAENPILSPEIVVRTSLQKRVGGYDPQLPKTADMEMFMRLASSADVGFIRGVDQAYYRVHGRNMSDGLSAIASLRQRRSVFEIALDRYGAALRNPERLSAIVHRQLGREALWAAGRAYDAGSPLRQSHLIRRALRGGEKEDETEIEQLLNFASECWPELSSHRLYRCLRDAGRIGPQDMAYMLNQKGRWWLRRRKWKYRGS